MIFYKVTRFCCILYKVMNEASCWSKKKSTKYLQEKQTLGKVGKPK
jgi:hypothetical protein